MPTSCQRSIIFPFANSSNKAIKHRKHVSPISTSPNKTKLQIIFTFLSISILEFPPRIPNQLTNFSSHKKNPNKNCLPFHRLFFLYFLLFFIIHCILHFRTENKRNSARNSRVYQNKTKKENKRKRPSPTKSRPESIFYFSLPMNHSRRLFPRPFSYSLYAKKKQKSHQTKSSFPNVSIRKNICSSFLRIFHATGNYDKE